MHKRPLSITLISVLGAGLAPAGLAADRAPPQPQTTPQAVESRIGNLERLIKHSAGAQRIASTPNAEAKRLREEAGSHLEAAQRLHADGDNVGASVELDQATQKMFAAVRAAGPGEAGVQKQREDYENRYESTKVLLSALQRIADEKGQQQRYAGETRGIQMRMEAAQRMAEKGNMESARAEIDKAYEAAKHAVETLRQGDTLVRSLNFATKEEEYRYELDRNDTHKMLVTELLNDRLLNDRAQKIVDELVAKAEGLRAKAEKQAAEGAFEAAIESLETATKELVRAIRSAGVYIPG